MASGPGAVDRQRSLEQYYCSYKPCIALRILNYGNVGIFLIMGSAGFISSTVS